MKITLHLPVSAYLIKYLEAKYGEEYKATETDWFGLLIISTLSRKSADHYHINRKSENLYYTVTLGISKAEHCGFFITQRKGDQIAKAIDNHFREQMYMQAVLNYQNFEIDYKTSILNYLESFNITEEDLHYETVRKDFNRNKAKIEQRLKIKL